MLQYAIVPDKGIRFKASRIAVAIASGIFLPQDPHRIGIVFLPRNSSRFSVWHESPAVIDQSFNFPVNGVAEYVTFANVGNWVQQQLFAIAGTAITVGVIELFNERKEI